MRRRALLGASAASLAVGRARAADKPIRIGVLNDQSGPYADVNGPGSVVAARLGVEAMGGSALGLPVEVLVGDHQNKPDIAVAIARKWFDEDGVDVVMDLANSAVALAMLDVVKQRNKISIPVGAITSELSGKSCSANSVQWAQDSWSNSVSTVRAFMEKGIKSFFYITVDYAFGIAIETDGKREIERLGGKFAGSVRHPTGTADYSSYLLQAQGSGAQVVVFANAGADTIAAIKQAHEFGLTPAQTLAAPNIYLTDIHALGLPMAQGLSYVTSWYWDMDDPSREWAKKFHAKIGKMPNDLQAAVCSATMHYLKGLAKSGTRESLATLAAMRALPVEDFFAKHGVIRADNKMVFDRYVARVKAPGESKGAWDYLALTGKVPAEQAFRPLADGGCPLVKA
jgi:branched-chain amino acid transport system substrate-binding protein